MYGRRSFSPSRTFEYLITIVKRKGGFVRGMQKLSEAGAVDEYGANCKNQKRRALNFNTIS
jgi:hypothetical protein